ncbi:hypothetical protein [Flammeovirga sp. SJP92]|uniref:hypothetical protein n=1 Tax=Flammeovirga sp. SJP92 TaxID=1775430 RepID=UPI0007871E11|nr:hypothetical protein [Flammeovirga sp. SJP92]KXX67172.1 hypothetical protein AVL50_27680 [Flammeovirga sp. SJP92]
MLLDKNESPYCDKYKKDLYIQRFIIGILGMLMPFLLYGFFNFTFLDSFSQYYYTRSAVFFIITVSTFSILLISYQGYEKTENEKVSDNRLTSIAGIMGLIVVLVPTKAISPLINPATVYALFGHSCNDIKLWIHNIAAIAFMSLVGGVSYFKFSKVDDKERNKKKNQIYKFFAIVIWVSVGFILICFIYYSVTQKSLVENYVFWGEFVAIEFFAFSWIKKSHILTLNRK